MSEAAGHSSEGSFRREEALRRLAGETFDVLVIGGGITGVGVALDAASRGLRTALVEKSDFASGTSSKSSKLVHGGVRYLLQHEVRLVYENLAERQRLLDNAPHLVAPLPFLIPLFGSDGVVSKTVARTYSTGLWAYDLTGGVRIGTRHRRVDRASALAHMPTLEADRLVAGFLYFDARTDDARLTLAILRTAALDYGAVAANYATVTGLLTSQDGRIAGARVRAVHGDGAGDGVAPKSGELEVRARAVVNASGVWSDDVRGLDHKGVPPMLRPAKGVHVSVPSRRLPCDIGAVIPVPKDRRSIFVVPWPEGEVVYLGTTDTAYDGPLDDPRCLPEDVEYVLHAANRATTSALTTDDVTGVWAGLRPLLAPHGGRGVSERTADLSRRHSVTTAPDGLVSVTGGKLTTYRKMAEDTMTAVVGVLGDVPRAARRSRTRRLRLRGAPAGSDALPDLQVTAPVHAHLLSRYGADAPSVLALADGRPELLEPVVDGLPYLGAEVVYAARAEMAESVEDVLSRRTRAHLQDARAAARAAPRVADLLAPELGWSPEESARQVAAFRAQVSGELVAAGLRGVDGHRMEIPAPLGRPSGAPSQPTG